MRSIDDNRKLPLISVIVPVYNVKEYLAECVDSIQNQSYQNTEIILVDDGSTDGSSEICENYRRIDSRIIVIHKNNGGQGSARNMALDISKGQYIAFLDADDVWDSDYLAFLYDLLVIENADISICDYRHIDENGSLIKRNKKPSDTIMRFSGEDAMITALYWTEFGVAPWAKLFKRELWDGIRFKEDRIYEDLATTYMVYDKAIKVVFSKQIKMSYRIRKNSDVHQPFNSKKIRILDSADEIIKYCYDRKRKVQNSAYSRALASSCFILFRIGNDEARKYFSTIHRCKKTIRKYRFRVMLDRKARIKTRIGATCSYLGFFVEKKIFSLVIGNK